MAENELFGDEPNGSGNGNGSNGTPKPNGKNGNGAKAAPVAKIKAASVSAPVAPTAGTAVMDAPRIDPFAGTDGGETMAAESSSEPGGATPLMAAPTSPQMYAKPALPARIADARQNGPELFAGEGLTFERKYTKEGQDVFDTVEWEHRTAAISGDKGEIVFEQKDCEIPKAWSMLATNVVVSKYFRGKVGTPQRENSVKQLVSRVADTIYNWGKQANYFATDKDADTFHDELKYLLLHQHMAFNSPVWFNLGVPGEKPQVSACFINKVEDTMESILTLAKTEGMLFKWGSGTGTNLSVLRSSKESLKGGGTASGPVSFMRGFDAFAGAIKCLTPDALVHTDKGMQTLGEIIAPNLAPGFYENDSVVLATKDGPTRISHVYVSPEAQTFRVTLGHTNLSLRGTADHPVLVLTPEFAFEWKKLPDLQKGDRVAVSRRTEMWPHAAPSFADFASVSRYAKKTLSYPTEMTPELARLLGYMVSEGCMDRERFRFCNADTDVFADFLHCVRSVFGVDDVSRNVSARVHPQTGVTTQVFEACWTNALRFLRHVGLTEANSRNKILPWSVRYAPRPLVVEFMRAYFEGDGHVSTHIYASSASEKLLREIQLLLLNMGMVGLLRPHPVNGTMYWSLYFRGEAAWQFVREIGFVSARKKAMAQFAGDKNTNIDTVPFLADVLRTRTSKNGYFRCADGQTRFVGFGFFNRKPGSGISYNRLRNTPQLADKLRVVDAALADTLETVMEREFFWDSVASVEEAEAAVTYDFTVPGTHSFVANGIINHNSGGKCFKAGSLVATPDGLVPIETLQTGDLVLTHVGPRPLADFMPNGVKMCFRVQTEEGYELEVTRGHKFAFWNELAGGYEVKPIEEFAPGEAMYVLTEASEGGQTIPLFVPEANDAPQATTTAEMRMPTELCPKLGYVLGLMYGDAELRTTYPFRVRVAFCKDAAGQASEARFRDYCQELFGEAPITLGDETNHRQVGYTRKRLVEFLAANNIAKGKANALQFPIALFQARPDVRAAFVAGIIDADGTYQARGGWSVSMIDRTFLVQFQRLLLSLGVPSKLKLSRAEKGNWQNLYRLNIVGFTFIDRLVRRIAPYSAKAAHNYVPSPGADKGWGYRPSLLPALKSRLERRGGYLLLERRVGMNPTTGYGALATVAATHPHLAVSLYAGELARCVQVHLKSVTPTELAETYDVEVQDAHLLCVNGIYASNTRRAAKMSILNADHPDIEEFVECKADAEKKAHALIEAGYSGAFNVPNGAYDSVFFQNANHSVRATDDFMRAVELDRDWTTAAVTNGDPMETLRARDLMHKIAQAAWVCGDPGMQFDTTANRWHTCANTDRINASNPCCITGDTLIGVADGRNAVPIRDIAGQVVNVYVWNHQTKRTTIAPMHTIEIKRHNAPVFRVTLDDGSSFRATDDHLIMLRDGSYRQVKDLQAGDSLNPFHSQVKQHAQGRSKRRYVYSGMGWRAQYRWIWENAHGVQPNGFHIHHADFNSLNDALENLDLLPEAQHADLHKNRMLGDSNPARRLMNAAWRANLSRATQGEKNPRYNQPVTDETRARMQEAAEARWSDPTQHETARCTAQKRIASARAEGRSVGRPVRKERMERCCPACRQNFVTARTDQVFCGADCRYSPLGLSMIGAKGGETKRGTVLTPMHREKLRVASKNAARTDDKKRAQEESLRVRCLKAARLLSDAGHDIGLESWDELRPVARQLGAAHVPRTETLRRVFGTDEALCEHTALYNHKVVSVEADGCEDVYDGTVDEYHNFAIVTSRAAGTGGETAPDYSGCFIHNSEFFFLDDTACNLASLNLMRFRDDLHEFDVESFRHAVTVTVTAMEIMVGFAAYPTDNITVNSFDYRPLGLGYANLGALLMARGLPYDSNEGRAYAAAITAILSGEGYTQSAKMAARVGPFAGYAKNRQPMLRVMQMHRDHVEAMQKELVPSYMVDASRKTWDAALDAGREHGYRNSQISVLAPTGCLISNSLVVTDKGLLRLDRLGNVHGEKYQAADFSVLTDEGERAADKFFVNGEDWTRRIVTRSGYSIQGTLKHRIKVVDKATGAWTWKRFVDIAPGDVAPLSMGQLAGMPQTVTLPPLGEEYWTEERVRLRGNYSSVYPQTMTPELAELIGYFMGGGTTHDKGPRFCVANADPDVAERVKALVRSLFFLQAQVVKQPEGCEIVVHSAELNHWWDGCGFAKRPPHENYDGMDSVPHIPDAVLASNDPLVYGAFLRGLFEADGTVTNGVPCWTTVKQSFSEEVKTLLLALGLPTISDTTQTGWGNSAAYRLRLRNSSYADTFRRAVGFMGQRKASLVTRAQGEQTARHDYVYVGRELVDELISASHPLRSAATQAMRRHDGAITRRTAQALLAETGDGRVAHALRFFYDTVSANEDGGMQPTFDLSVPENLTYIAQGFVSHNTIGFLMDCDTTGVEPDIAIVKYKSLVGGGMFKIVNQTVPEALERLGYSASERKAILEYIDQNDTIEGAPGLSDAHLPVFDCAFRAKNGTRTIHYMGHIKMMSGVQPFISGAISKTVNMPHDATPDDIGEAYMQAWKLGIKALAIYRDGSKKTQPLSTGKTEDKAVAKTEAAPAVEARPLRRRLPDERQALTHKFSVGGHEGYITIGLYPDQTPGEIFITMSKEGSVVSGLMDAFATSISLALQYGVPLRTLVEKFMHSRFEPSGFTGNPQIPMAKSIMDYLFRYMALKFLDKDERANVGLIADQQDDYDNDGNAGDSGNAFADVAPTPAAAPTNGTTVTLSAGTPMGQAGPQGAASPAQTGQTRTQAAEREVFVTQADAPPCPECGSITTRNGACYRCNNCGTSIGCS